MSQSIQATLKYYADALLKTQSTVEDWADSSSLLKISERPVIESLGTGVNETVGDSLPVESLLSIRTSSIFLIDGLLAVQAGIRLPAESIRSQKISEELFAEALSALQTKERLLLESQGTGSVEQAAGRLPAEYLSSIQTASVFLIGSLLAVQAGGSLPASSTSNQTVADRISAESLSTTQVKDRFLLESQGTGTIEQAAGRIPVEYLSSIQTASVFLIGSLLTLQSIETPAMETISGVLQVVTEDALPLDVVSLLKIPSRLLLDTLGSNQIIPASETGLTLEVAAGLVQSSRLVMSALGAISAKDNFNTEFKSTIVGQKTILGETQGVSAARGDASTESAGSLASTDHSLAETTQTAASETGKAAFPIEAEVGGLAASRSALDSPSGERSRSAGYLDSSGTGSALAAGSRLPIASSASLETMGDVPSEWLVLTQRMQGQNPIESIGIADAADHFHASTLAAAKSSSDLPAEFKAAMAGQSSIEVESGGISTVKEETPADVLGTATARVMTWLENLAQGSASSEAGLESLQKAALEAGWEVEVLTAAKAASRLPMEAMQTVSMVATYASLPLAALANIPAGASIWVELRGEVYPPGPGRIIIVNPS